MAELEQMIAAARSAAERAEKIADTLARAHAEAAAGPAEIEAARAVLVRARASARLNGGGDPAQLAALEADLDQAQRDATLAADVAEEIRAHLAVQLEPLEAASAALTASARELVECEAADLLARAREAVAPIFARAAALRSAPASTPANLADVLAAGAALRLEATGEEPAEIAAARALTGKLTELRSLALQAHVRRTLPQSLVRA